jgi:sodium/potassium-transporting ATPase subunit alpha
MLTTENVPQNGRIQNLTDRNVYLFLNTSPSGLTSEEAASRLAEVGPNELVRSRRISLVKKLGRQFTHYLAILLWIAAFLALFSEWMQPRQGMLSLGIAIIAVIFINAIFTFVQEYRAERSIEALHKLLPFHAMVIRDGVEQEISGTQLVPGDRILLKEGDRVPADTRIMESFTLTVNNACLTGESDGWLLDSVPCFEPLLRSTNIAFAGTSVVSGHGWGIVFATGMRTEFGRIVKLTAEVQEPLTPLQKQITRATRVLSAVATVMGILFFCLGFLLGRTFWQNFLFAVGIIVANVPEGLLPTLTLSLAMAGQRMAKRKSVVKSLNSVETLGCVTVICTDKTGTLTENSMAVRKIWCGESILNVDDSEIPQNTQHVLQTAGLCSRAVPVDGTYHGDPVDVAILNVSRRFGISIPAMKMDAEFPFDPVRRRMTTVFPDEGRARAFTKGATEKVLDVCNRVNHQGETISLTPSLKQAIQTSCESMMADGLRVIALSSKELESGTPRSLGLVESEMIFDGLIGLQDPPRKEVPDAIRKCREAGIRVIMITGDAAGTAKAIARQIHLSQTPFLLSGDEMDLMDNVVLKQHLRNVEIIFYRSTPAHKLRIVSLLKEMGEIVAVTGDGVNDAPALKQADIGIAMGAAGTDVAKEAADLILMDDNFSTIVDAIEEGRGVYENIKRVMSYILSSNVPEIVPYLAYVLFAIPLPLTVMQILAVDLGTDVFPALALGAEKPTEELMRRPPRKHTEKILNLRLLSRAYGFLGMIEAFAAMFGFFYLLREFGWKYGELFSSSNPIYVQATTACLAAIIVTQIGNVFASRNFHKSLLSIGIFSNRYVLAGVVMEILILLWIVYHPWGNAVFATRPFPPHIWLVLAPFAFVLFFLEEGRKWIASRIGDPTQDNRHEPSL